MRPWESLRRPRTERMGAGGSGGKAPSRASVINLACDHHFWHDRIANPLIAVDLSGWFVFPAACSANQFRATPSRPGHRQAGTQKLTDGTCASSRVRLVRRRRRALVALVPGARVRLAPRRQRRAGGSTLMRAAGQAKPARHPTSAAQVRGGAGGGSLGRAKLPSRSKGTMPNAALPSLASPLRR